MLEDRPLGLVMDCDAGWDDAAAICLARSPAAAWRLTGVATVFGNASASAATRDLRQVLIWLGDYGVPVAQGVERQVESNSAFAVLESVVGALPAAAAPSARPNPAHRDPLSKTMAAGDRLIALAPLTNVAAALSRAKAAQIVILGGAFGPGNATEAAEFNFFMDPAAADTVLQAPIEKALLTLDLCRTTDARTFIFPDLTTRAADLWNRLLTAYVQASPDGAPLFDPLAVLYAADPGAFTTEPRRLGVDRSSGALQEAPAAAPTTVVVSADLPRLVERARTLLAAD